MPTIEADASDLYRRADLIGRAGERMLAALERRGTERGSDAVRFIQRRFRTGAPHTTPSRTARRTGLLYDAYDSTVERANDGRERGIDLRVGLIKPTLDDQVKLYGRVHEGLDAEGNPVAEFVIVPRAAEYLRFQLPPEKGGGWVTTKGPIRLKPRPSFPEVQKRLPPYLAQDIEASFREAVEQ